MKAKKCRIYSKDINHFINNPNFSNLNKSEYNRLTFKIGDKVGEFTLICPLKTNIFNKSRKKKSIYWVCTNSNSKKNYVLKSNNILLDLNRHGDLEYNIDNIEWDKLNYTEFIELIVNQFYEKYFQQFMEKDDFKQEVYLRSMRLRRFINKCYFNDLVEFRMIKDDLFRFKNSLERKNRIEIICYLDDIIDYPDYDMISKLDKAENSTLKNILDDIFGELTPRTRRVLEIEYGFDDSELKTHEETAVILSKEFNLVSGGRIQQITSKALHKLRCPRIAKRLKDFL